MPSTSVFISYRRSDSASSTGRIADRLKTHFGPDRIFFDVDTIPLGIDFRRYVGERLDKTDVFLVVIGDDWLEAKSSEGGRRIDDPADNVHVEVAAALARSDVPVIPVLVGSATSPPGEEKLPPPLRGLATRNAIGLRSDTTFEGQMERLIEYIEGLSQERRTGQHRIPEEPVTRTPVAPPQAAKPAGWGKPIGIGVGLLVLALAVFAMWPGGEADLVVVPDLIGDSLADAQALLEGSGLEYDWSYTADPDRPDSDLHVVDMEPDPDSMAPRGSHLTLHLEYF